ncbi:related to S.pombe beta-transducin [Cephalotrichum gorgonifer]|uniref:Related to S.pombe beta-transducin n=1 Tax=Cephalotrichum gorgonifer TaxID=2041049 RepID=A0AAE8MV83_9PEZI|nr:related to S.pombe beta-transducin [Cephalotrichum gorgonifer]
MAFPDRPVARLLGANGPVHSVTYSSSPGTYILSGSSDRSIRLYNPGSTTTTNNNYPPTEDGDPSNGAVPEGKLIQTYSAHGYEVLSISVSGDNQCFASSGGDRVVFLWDVATAKTIRRFGSAGHGHTARINCVSFGGESDSVLVSGGFDTSVRVWDVRSSSGKPIQVLDDARDAVTCLVVRDAEIVAGSVDGSVRSYDIRMGRCVADEMGASVTSLALTRDGCAMLVGTLDSKLRLMDRGNGKCLKTFEHAEWRNSELRVQALLGGKERYVLAGDELAGSADGLAGGAAGEGRVWAWDLLTGEVVARIRVPWGPPGYQTRKKIVGRDGKQKSQNNIISCMAWREDGWGDQFCVGGTSGVVTVYGSR